MMANLGVALLVALCTRTVTLADAERAALAQKPEVRAAHANTEAAAARTEQARAPALPQVKAELVYERTTGNRVQHPGQIRAAGNPLVPPGTNSATTYDWYEGQISASQLLWDFGQTLNKWRAAEARAAGFADSERAARLDALVAVRAAFFQARAQKDLVAVAQQTLQNRERHFAQIEGFVKAGARPEIDLAQARADRANARVRVVNAENGYAMARAELNRAMGTTGDTDYDVADETYGAVAGEAAALGPLIDEAIRARPEIAALEAQVRAQELTARAARGGYLPALSAIGGADDRGVSFNRYLDTTPGFSPQAAGGLAWNFFFGVQLSWPLFQGFLTHGQVREANATIESLRAQRDALVQQIWVAVEQAFLAVRAAKAALTAADEALAASRERLRLAEGRYSSGVGNIIELSDAELAAADAATQRVVADYNLAAARAALALALARG